MASQVTLSDSTVMEMRTIRSNDQVFNKVIVTTYPAAVDSSDIVLASISDEIEIAPGETRTVTLRFRDPNQEAVRVSAISTVTMAAGTDYNMASYSGGGGNLNGDLTITETVGANSAELALENTGTQHGYVTTLQIRGKGVYFHEPVESTSESGSADRPLTFNLPYQSVTVIGSTIADELLGRYDTIRTRVERVTFNASESSTLMTAALDLDVGDRITLSETVTGISGDYFINAVRLDIRDNTRVICSWLLDDYVISNYWLLGDATYSVLGVTTYPVN